MEDKVFLDMVNVGLTLKKDEGLNQYKLAKRLGVNDSLVNKWLRGHRPIPEDMKARLIAELGLSRAWARLSAPAPLESIR